MKVLVWKGGEMQDTWEMPGKCFTFTIEPGGCLVVSERIFIGTSSPALRPVKAYAPGQWRTAESRE